MGWDLMAIHGGHGVQSCERLRLALESFEPEKDHEGFVRDYGTGNAMPDPPQFVNYSSAEGVPLTSSASKVTSRPAQFSRVTQRINRIATAVPPQPQPQPEDEPVVNTAGVGSGNRPPNPNDNTLARGTTLSRSSTRRQAPPTNGNSTTNGHVNGVSPGSSPPANVHRSTNNAPSAPLTQHELVVGENSYRVDLSKDQQATSHPPSNSSKVGGEADPMVQAMANLRSGGATVGRSATRRVPAPDTPGNGTVSASPSKALTPPIPVSPTKSIDYRNSAEIVVGAPPIARSHSRSTSPVPPTANFMQPPSQAPAPVVDTVIDSYHQSFPGERRSRSNSRRASFNAPQPVATQSQASQGNHLERPPSREGGHAGVGANGRSRSPSLSHPVSPGTSPVLSGPARGGNHLDQGAGQGQYRATTPNSVGIALDPQGNVAMDSMAEMYRQQQQAQARPGQAPPPSQALPPAPMQYQQLPAQVQQMQAPGGGLTARPSQRQTGITNPYVPPASWQTQPSAPSPQQYVVSPAATQQAPHHTPAYVQPPHPYANAPPQMYHATQLNYGMQQPPQQPPSQQQQQQQQQRQPVQHGTTGSGSGDYYPPPQHQGYAQPPPQQQQQLQRPQPYQHVAYGGGGYRSLSPGPVNRSPSPQPMALTQPQPQPVSEPPTRQYTEDGRGVLFYGTVSFLGGI